MASEKNSGRYELKQKIGAGDFATVYLANDVKLGREVAVKKLHSQFIDDQEKLARYWQEAQLLVSLEHPNIMTIYDIVRSKGVLVLELMQGSLKQIYGAQPMPVDDVRQTIAQAAAGLGCLHEKGIIHGDVKPANLLLSRQSVVKLGDFGLARRVSDSEGSLLKGTTKYMAPELVSDQFGDVGPASDLYSLGFSALELLVGPEFDSLFPDLIAFGRDQQMAWMMWHCSADRKLPPMQSMLAGVPDDVANVIQRLTHKDQAKRYKTAAEVIADLSPGGTPVGQHLKDEAAAREEEARKAKKKRRIAAAIASVFSIIACTLILWMSMPKEEPPAWQAPPPLRGTVKNLRPRDSALVVDLGAGDWKEISLSEQDPIKLNRKLRTLSDLKLGDRVVLKKFRTEDEQTRIEVTAFRPEKQQGTIKSLDPENGKLVLSVSGGDEEGKEFSLDVNKETNISLNGKAGPVDSPLGIDALAAEDRVEVFMSDDESGMLALSVDAIRQLELEGFVRNVNLRVGEITVGTMVADGSYEDGTPKPDREQLTKLALDPSCVYTLNGLKSMDRRLIRAGDLLPNDRITVKYDLKVTHADAYRVISDEGEITSINYSGSSFVIAGRNDKAEYRVKSDTRIILGSETVSIADLRVGDSVEVTHESPDDASPMLLSLEAQRPTDDNKWAIVIANDTFDDKSMPKMSKPGVSASWLHDRLTSRYGIPASQAVLLVNEDRTRIKQDVSQIIPRVPAGAQLYVFLSAPTFSVDQDNVYVITSETLAAKVEQTSMTLDWLIDQMDQSKTDRKILFLDCSQPEVTDPRQKSGPEVVSLMKELHRGGYPQSTYIFASGKQGETMATDPKDSGRGLFASVLAEAFAGGADSQMDNDVEITELVEYVREQVSSIASASGGSQSPVLFLPDATPARITAQAKEAILAQISKFGSRPEQEVLLADANQANRLVNNQPEPMLVYGLLLVESSKMSEALEVLEKVRLDHPDCLIAHRAVVWWHFYKKDYAAGVGLLQEMVKQIPLPNPKKGEAYSSQQMDAFEWAGRLRGLALKADWNRPASKASITALDSEVAKHGDESKQRYRVGYQAGNRLVVENLQRVAAKPDDPQVKLTLQRITTYVPPIASRETMEQIRARLDWR